MASDLERIVARAQKHYYEVAETYLRARGGVLHVEPDVAPSAASDFTSSDAWLLLAIKTAQADSSSATLAEIIGAGDAINHAIFMDEELKGGFYRLAHGGHISVQGDVCFVTEQFENDWQARGAGGKRSLDKHLQVVETMLGV